MTSSLYDKWQIQEGTLNGLTQTDPMILVLWVTVTFNDISNIYLIFILQVPIKHKKRSDNVFLPSVAENVQHSAFQIRTAPSIIP